MHKRLLQLLLLFFLFFFLLPACRQEKTFKGNLHTHLNYSFDGFMGYEEAIETASALGFDFLVITDHNVIADEIKEKCSSERRLLCIIGEEVTKQTDHILGIDIKNEIMPIRDNKEIISRIHQQGGIAIAAHPGHDNGGLSLEEIKLMASDLDAMECWNEHHQLDNYQPTLEQLSREIKLPCVYNSDAHYASNLSLVSTTCTLKELTPENLKKAVQGGRCWKS